MIDNFKKIINAAITKIGSSVYKETINVDKLQTSANNLLETLKTKHQGSTISDQEIAVYRPIYEALVRSYNRSYAVSNAAKNRLRTIDRIVSTVNTTANTLNILVNILQILPAPIAPFTPMGIVITLSGRLANAASIIDQIKKFLNPATLVLQTLLDKYNVLLSKLTTLNSTLQSILALLVSKSTTFQSEAIIESIAQDDEFTTNIVGGISNILGTYKSYTFILKTDNDPAFDVGGIKRKYAVAILDGKEVYYSDKSYTLNPDILIEQLKLQIDE